MHAHLERVPLPAFGRGFKDTVLKNVVSYEDNVRSVLTKVSLGEGDAGIVYVSDVISSPRTPVKRIDIPRNLNIIASYPIAPVSDSKNAANEYETPKITASAVKQAQTTTQP